MARAKKYFIWIIILAAIVAGGYFYLKSKKPVTQYTTAAVTRGNLTQTVSTTGTLDSDKKYELAFQTGGTVTEMRVDVGDRVTKGQELAKIDPGTLLSQLAQAQAQVKVQKATLANMRKQVKAFTFQQREAQKAQVNSAEAGVAIIQDQLQNTVIISPIDGVVLKRFANVGDTTFVNAARSTSILTVAPDGNLVVVSNIPESDIVKIKMGLSSVITFDALTPEDKYEASVTQIDPAATVIQGVVYYAIKLTIANIDQRLKPGMSTNVDIHTQEKDNVLTIPLRAVQTEGTQKFVEILNSADNTTKKVQVETGLEGDGGMVEIKSGLQEGQKVVTFTKSV